MNEQKNNFGIILIPFLLGCLLGWLLGIESICIKSSYKYIKDNPEKYYEFLIEKQEKCPIQREKLLREYPNQAFHSSCNWREFKIDEMIDWSMFN